MPQAAVADAILGQCTAHGARWPALEALAVRLVEKEVMDGAELRQLLEQYDPGPKLVPGSQSKETRPLDDTVEITKVERRAEGEAVH